MAVKNPALSSEFMLYRLTDPDSAWGHEYVAVNEKQGCCISLSSDCLSVDEGDSELREYLETDYVSTGEKIHFPINDIRDIIVDRYSCEEFSLIAHRNAGEINSLTIVLGRFETYREHDFQFIGKEIAYGSGKFFFADDNGEIASVMRIRDILTPLFDSAGPD